LLDIKDRAYHSGSYVKIDQAFSQGNKMAMGIIEPRQDCLTLAIYNGGLWPSEFRQRLVTSHRQYFAIPNSNKLSPGTIGI
jgi:hypothetical protein